MKHAHHAFDIDVPGKDSYEHRAAGAREVMISSANRWALMHELKGDAEPSLAELIARMSPVDLLLVEGFKWEDHPKLEVHRPSVGKPLLQPDDPNVVAVASDTRLSGLSVPLLDLSDIAGIADFIMRRSGLLAA
jgi:molybdopterin-guanine dinucleotide biosynthesis protein B